MVEKQQEKRIFFIIPAFNEGKNIAKVIENIGNTVSYRYKIILIDDGSSDFLASEVIKSFPNVLVIRHLTNKGLGEAIKTGFLYVLKECNGKDIIVTQEADNTSDALILDSIIEKIAAGYDIVVAGYHSGGGKIIGVANMRKILSYLANRGLKNICHIKGISTYTSLYRSYSCALIKKAFEVYGDHFITYNRFASVPEILIKLSKLNGVKITEVPGALRGDKRLGKSKMKIIRNIVDYIWLLVKRI
ncbi:MAG: glycosyltransferase [Candidatus Stahlbacteria bacterium]|nr:glycosyltransferase [Candidatus Stahlbacteria bacterium]